jgi:hypothetical protein
MVKKEKRRKISAERQKALRKRTRARRVVSEDGSEREIRRLGL